MKMRGKCPRCKKDGTLISYYYSPDGLLLMCDRCYRAISVRDKIKKLEEEIELQEWKRNLKDPV